MRYLLLILLLSACQTTGPTPFEDSGVIAPTPQGCIEGRQRDVDC